MYIVQYLRMYSNHKSYKVTSNGNYNKSKENSNLCYDRNMSYSISEIF